MATKPKTITKSVVTPRTVKGSSGLKQNKLNWKFIIVLLVLVTGVGGFFAYKSQVKATWRDYIPGKDPYFTSNNNGFRTKDNGTKYWKSTSSSSQLTFKKSYLQTNDRYCVDWSPSGSRANIGIYASGLAGLVQSRDGNNLCVTTPSYIPDVSSTVLTITITPSYSGHPYVGDINVWRIY